MSEYVSEALSGHERTLAAEGTTHTGYTVKTEEITEQVYDIPVVDDVMDLKFSGARVAYISIEKVEKTAAEKPNIWSVGDSTIGNLPIIIITVRVQEILKHIIHRAGLIIF